jgi:hypothetical protein
MDGPRDHPGRRLGAFAVALVVTFGGAYGLGRALDDRIEPASPAVDHGSDHDGPADHGTADHQTEQER